jgi:hypothetical protein
MMDANLAINGFWIRKHSTELGFLIKTQRTRANLDCKGDLIHYVHRMKLIKSDPFPHPSICPRTIMDGPNRNQGQTSRGAEKE